MFNNKLRELLQGDQLTEPAGSDQVPGQPMRSGVMGVMEHEGEDISITPGQEVPKETLGSAVGDGFTGRADDNTFMKILKLLGVE